MENSALVSTGELCWVVVVVEYAGDGAEAWWAWVEWVEWRD